jgi:superoxide dismutase, Fe-Mn family
MKAVLPKLAYGYADLEPYIDRLTMEIHHTKHHQAYVDNFNKAIDGKNLGFASVEDILKNHNKLPKNIRQTVVNNAGGHVNHTFFWKIMTPAKSSSKPKGRLKEILDSKFGNTDSFMEKFTESALSLFGSGWVFLIPDKNQGVKIKKHSFQNSPLTYGVLPILGLDLWEHAYYLKYQNRRADYIKAWWNVVNWGEVEENLVRALSSSPKI